jgi:pimeloyl-ACP methyl ester carboxylesterase
MAQTAASPRGVPLTRSDPDPARDYPAALARLAAFQARDGAEVNPVCRTYLLTHGHQTERTIVLLHGMTNCPAQFTQLAPLFFKRGYNVLVPRIPRHGLIDRDTEELKNLTPQELRTFGDAVVDIARGLGERVTVAGISAGGVVTAWIAQFRPDVELAVVMAPAFGLLPNWPLLGTRANRLATSILSWLPNIMTQRILGPKEGPPHGYNGFATHGLAATFRLGTVVLRTARRKPIDAQRALVLMNDNDQAVNNAMIRDLARAWRARAGNRVAFYTFSARMGLVHEFIEPQRPHQRVDMVYPILLKLITGS